MKEYIKPTFITAGLFPVALAGNSCATNADDLDVISMFLNGANYLDSKVFAIGECEDEYDCNGMYCKYTHMESDAAKVLTS